MLYIFNSDLISILTLIIDLIFVIYHNILIPCIIIKNYHIKILYKYITNIINGINIRLFWNLNVSSNIKYMIIIGIIILILTFLHLWRKKKP